MELKNFFAQDLQGNVIPSPTVYLYLPGTTTLATGLEDKDGNALTNPFTGSANGQVVVSAPDGDYDMRVTGAGRDTTMRVRFIDVSDNVALAQAAAEEAAQSAAEAAEAAESAASGSPPTIPAFVSKTDATVGALTESNAVTVSGITTTVWPALVRGDGSPEMQVNAGPWSTSAIFRSGDTLKLRNTAAVADLNYVANLYTTGATASWTLASMAPVESVLSSARILIDWSDAAATSGAYAPNKNAPGATGNMFALTSGMMSNETGAATPTRTLRVPGPGGANTAMRLVATANNQVNSFFRVGNGHTIPAGQYTLRFRARAVGGTGPHGFVFGMETAYVAGTAVDLDWTDPANEAATTFTATFTYSTSTDIAIRLNTAGTQIEIDQLQCYPGDASAMPPWSAEVFTSGRPAYSYTGALPMDANQLVDITTRPSGMLLIDPAFPNRHTYSEYTILNVSSVDASQSAAGHFMNVHPGDGGSTTGNILSLDGAAPYVGEYNTFPSGTRSQMGINVRGKGLAFMAQRRDAAQRTVFFDTIPVFKSATAFTPQNISIWTVGSFTTAQTADLRSSLAPGKYAYTVVWDSALSDSELADAVTILRQQLTVRSIPTINFDWHVISGDSNSTRADGDWSQLVTAAGFHSPGPDMLTMITSVGGQGIDNIDVVGGRFDTSDGPGLLRGTDNGRTAFYHLCIGTNDWDILNAYVGTVAQEAAQYVTRLQALIQRALDLHPRVNVIWYSLLPQTAVSRPNWEAQRLIVNDTMRAWIAATDRVHICDVGGSATIGSRALQAGGGGAYYLSDEIHLTPAGDIEFANIQKPALAAARAAAGL